ncbi:MAG: cyclase family protein [Actinomycetota bacterium]|nr:cyclase family protein [Actinomycetota bacterium]
MSEQHIYAKLYDVSIDIHEAMPTWPGDPGFERTLLHSISGGASSDVSVIKMGSHTGTHVDAPAHFLEGAPTVDQLPLDVLVGEAAVFGLDVETAITPAELGALGLEGVSRVLFKTRNSALWQKKGFAEDFVYFTPDAAAYLVEAGVRLVGIDYLSVGEYHKGTEVHHAFLKSGIVIVEGLNLSGVEPGRYEMMCLPLKIIGADGAPARVLLGRR